MFHRFRCTLVSHGDLCRTGPPASSDRVTADFVCGPPTAAIRHSNTLACIYQRYEPAQGRSRARIIGVEGFGTIGANT